MMTHQGRASELRTLGAGCAVDMGNPYSRRTARQQDEIERLTIELAALDDVPTERAERARWFDLRGMHDPQDR